MACVCSPEDSVVDLVISSHLQWVLEGIELWFKQQAPLPVELSDQPDWL